MCKVNRLINFSSDSFEAVAGDTGGAIKGRRIDEVMTELLSDKEAIV